MSETEIDPYAVRDEKMLAPPKNFLGRIKYLGPRGRLSVPVSWYLLRVWALWPAGHFFGGYSWRACPNRLFKLNSLVIRLSRVIHTCAQSIVCPGRYGKFPGPFGWDCWRTFPE